MPVKLLSYTKGDKDQSLQDLVAYCARVSNPANQSNTETNEKLIKYLIKNHHWSPLEMVHICLEIETTRDIGRQILRHRSFSFQEFSQRYAEATLGFSPKEARLQDTKNRQNSIEVHDTDLKEIWESKQNEIARLSEQTYQWALSKVLQKNRRDLFYLKE